MDPKISRGKLRREIEQWKSSAPHQQRGWLLLRHDEEQLVVELAFFGRLAINAGSGPLPIVACAIRLTYENYDLWPPSLAFIDVVTRQPAKPHVRAVVTTPTGPRDVLIEGHPETQMPFFCMPGNREYHTHPQHTGDSWLLHRALGEGSVTTICERVWQSMVRNIVGLNVQVQALPMWPLQAQLGIAIAQGPTDRPAAAQRLPQAAEQREKTRADMAREPAIDGSNPEPGALDGEAAPSPDSEQIAQQS